MGILLGIKIQEIGRTFVVNDTYFEPFTCMDTLYFKTNSSVFQLIKANKDGLHLQISPSKNNQPIIDPDFEIEPDDKLIYQEIKIKHFNLPLKVKSIIEFWAGSEDKHFLIGFILHGNCLAPN